MDSLAVLVSGAGTLLEAMIHQELPISFVAADRECRGLEIARKARIPCALVQRTNFKPNFDRVAYTRQMVCALEEHHVLWVAMAGFMTRFEWPMFDAFSENIFNTHPSLLPAFKGEYAVRDALNFGVKVTGCTIHEATLELGDGPILAQEAVRVEDDDSVETLHERIKQVERILYPATLRKLIGAS